MIVLNLEAEQLLKKLVSAGVRFRIQDGRLQYCGTIPPELQSDYKRLALALKTLVEVGEHLWVDVDGPIQ